MTKAARIAATRCGLLNYPIRPIIGLAALRLQLELALIADRRTLRLCRRRGHQQLTRKRRSRRAQRADTGCARRIRQTVLHQQLGFELQTGQQNRILQRVALRSN
jgi:hypothetical protein